MSLNDASRLPEADEMLKRLDTYTRTSGDTPRNIQILIEGNRVTVIHRQPYDAYGGYLVYDTYNAYDGYDAYGAYAYGGYAVYDGGDGAEDTITIQIKPGGEVTIKRS